MTHPAPSPVGCLRAAGFLEGEGGVSRTPLRRRLELDLLRDLEVAKLGVMCAKKPAKRERWMARVDELRAKLRAEASNEPAPSE